LHRQGSSKPYEKYEAGKPTGRSGRERGGRQGRPAHLDLSAALPSGDLDVVDETTDDREAHFVLLGLGIRPVGAPGTRRTLAGPRVRRLVVNLDGELLLLLGQQHPHRRRDAVALVQSDGSGAGLAYGEPDLVEYGLLHSSPARHRCRHESGGPDVFG